MTILQRICIILLLISVLNWSSKAETIAPWDYNAAQNIVGLVSSFGGGLLLAGSCTSNTGSMPGATTNMVVVATPTTYPGDGIQWQAYVSSAGIVTVKMCGLIAITPGATSFQVRVIQ